jgi:hypothetical protein
VSNQLPALPQTGAAISAEDVQRWERQVTTVVTAVEDVERLDEWRNQAAALETYLRGKEMQAPMMGAQRRIEARIGQLLGPAPKRGGKEMNQHAGSFHSDVRRELRLLAKAFNGECELNNIEWRTSRRGLVSLIRNRMPKPKTLAPTKATGRTGARITVPEDLTAEELCRQAMALESNGSSSESAAKTIGVSAAIYRMMRDIVTLSEIPYLTRWDKAVVATALDDLNENRQVRRNRKTVDSIAKHLWGPALRGTHSYQKAAGRRVEGFENACRAVANICASTSRLDLPYLNEKELKEADTVLETAGQNIKAFQAKIKRLHKIG